MRSKPFSNVSKKKISTKVLEMLQIFIKKWLEPEGLLSITPLVRNLSPLKNSLYRKNQRLGGDTLDLIFLKINLHQFAQNWPNNHLKLMGPP